MTVLHPSNVVLCYDGTLEGFLSAVFDAYARHIFPQKICQDNFVQLGLDQQIIDVPTDRAHAERVRVGLIGRAGIEVYRSVNVAYLVDDEDKETTLFAYIVHAMQQGHRVRGDLTRTCVARTGAYVQSVYNERERMYQFLRFEQLENGVFFACINPRANVIPIMMGHFVERLSTQPFVIFDEAHQIAGVHCDGITTMVLSDALSIPDRSRDEAAFQRLWKCFYDAVSNEQRYNPALRRSLVPKRLWRNMTEFKLAVEQRSPRQGTQR